MKKIFSIMLFAMFAVINAIASISNTSGGIQINTADGWNEALYVEWAQFSGATNYAVYVKGGQYSDYTKIDNQLIRSYGSYNRADALGLKAGNYSVKVVPVVNGAEDASKASSASDLVVKNYNREGYAHKNAKAGIGAYNNDGTLKSGARVIYVSKANAKTVTLDMIVDSKGKTETRTGIQDIIQAYEKGQETRPLAVRIIGLLKYADMPELGSSAIGLQVKGKGQDMNLTIEGVGNDATFHGFGVLARSCKYVELRNFAVMVHPEDGISFDTDNEHIWGHNLDIFYGKNKGGDKAKGDGSFDVKGTLYATVSANHFWDAGKCNLNSNGDEVDYVTYLLNWYDHSDSRHPRVRKSQHLHVYNNYYDGNAKYGVGSTTGSCIFVENNYFRNCKYPMLISKQGSDIHNGVGSSADTKGTFSSEDGGIIKAYGNFMTGQNSFEPYIAGDATYSKHFDAYVATTRDEKVPDEVKTLKGGTGYNNFDTESDFYQYTPLKAEDVPGEVTGSYGAGRCQKGDFTWKFNNATEDKNSEVIDALSKALEAYTSKLQSIYGDMGATIITPDDPQTPDNPEQPENPETPENPDTPENPGTDITVDGAVCSFSVSAKAPSMNIVKVSGNYSNSKGTVTYNGTSYTDCVKMESSTEIKVTPASNCTVTFIFGSSEGGKKLYLDGNDYRTDNKGMYAFSATANKTYTLTKGDAINLFLITFSTGGGSDTPEQPENPETPVQPENPETPEQPVDPVDPAKTTTLIDYPTSKAGVEIKGSSVESNNTIQLKNGYVGKVDGVEGVAGNGILLKVDGGFKKGDVITIAGTISVKTSDASYEKKVATTAKVATINEDNTTNDIHVFAAFGNTTETGVGNSGKQSYTLEANFPELWLVRDGGTTATVTTITVTRPASVDPVDPPTSLNLKKNNIAGFAKYFNGRNIVIEKNGKKFNAAGAEIK